jgi:hypothetical protein
MWLAGRSKQGFGAGHRFQAAFRGELDGEGFDNVKDWKYIKEVWEKELDGYVPRYCSVPRKKFAESQDHLLENIRYENSRIKLLKAEIRRLKSKIFVIKTGEAF